MSCDDHKELVNEIIAIKNNLYSLKTDVAVVKDGLIGNGRTGLFKIVEENQKAIIGINKKLSSQEGTLSFIKYIIPVSLTLFAVIGRFL